MTCAFINILKIYYSIKNKSTGTRITNSAALSYTNVNPLLPPPRGGAYLVQTHLRGEGGGVNRDGRLTWEGSLFNLAKTTVSVLHKELDEKEAKLKYKKLEIMQPGIKNKSKILFGELTIPDQSRRSFTVVIVWYSYHYWIIIGGGEGGDLLNVLPMKRGAY